MEVSTANASSDGEEALVPVSDVSTAASETTSLLPAKTSEEETDSNLHNPSYGSLGADPEQASQDASHSGTERRYSNTFVARTVIALLIGELSLPCSVLPSRIIY
jgi:hypothetical protein